MVRDPDGQWWQTGEERTDGGDWLVTIQHADGRLQRVVLLPTPSLADVITLAARAFAEGDRRNRDKSAGSG